MKRGLIVIFLVSLVAGCCPCKRGSSSSSYEKKDSMWTVESKKAISLEIPQRQIHYSFIVECDSLTNKPKPVKNTVTGDKIKASYEIDKNGLFVGAVQCDSLKKTIEVLQRENFHLSKESRKEVQKIEVPISRWYDIASRWLNLILILVIIVLKIFN